jgi:hypothetical protein
LLVEASVIVPTNEPTGKPVEFTETVIVVGVVRDPDGEMESQPAGVEAAEAVNVIAAPDEETVMACPAGFGPPCRLVNVKVVGATDSVGEAAPDTVNVTPTVIVLLTLARVTVPVNVPAVRPVRDTEALMVLGVVSPPDGVIESQPAGVDAAVAVKANGAGGGNGN